MEHNISIEELSTCCDVGVKLKISIYKIAKTIDLDKLLLYTIIPL